MCNRVQERKRCRGTERVERQICDLLVSRWRGEGCGWGADPREGSSDWIHVCTSPGAKGQATHRRSDGACSGPVDARCCLDAFTNHNIIGSSNARERIAEVVEIVNY